MRGISKQLFALLLLSSLGSLLISGQAMAEETVADEVNNLNDEIVARQARLDELNSRLDSYSDIIRQKEAEARSLNNEVAIIDNKVASLQLDIEASKLEIDNTEAEVQVLDLQITEETKSAERQKAMLASVLRQIQQSDDVGMLEIVFSHDNFSDLFEQLSQLESVHSDLHDVLESTQQMKEDLESKKGAKADKLASLVSLQEAMEREEDQLEESIGSKEILLVATQSSEAQYEALARELREEQSYIDSQVANLQKQVDKKIADSDGAVTGSTIVSWPLDDFIITTRFHDPTYPFKYLWPHSGLDLAAPSGTPVQAAAPGYVAFAKTGRLYGNYVMIINGNGIATLYAHLSRIDVKTDEFVGRGDVIGLVGSTGFSTGPHLHFEVRLDGIPVDPLGYLVQ